MQKWRILGSKYYYRSPFGNLRCDRVELPNGRIIEEYNVCEYTDWVNCVAITTDGKILVERQYRHAAGDFFFEIPAGTPEPGESPEQAVVRELLEETGYSSPHPPILLGGFHTNPARNDNRIWSFLFTDCEKTADTHFDPTEEIELQLWTLDELERAIDEGRVTQESTIAALGRARRKLGL